MNIFDNSTTTSIQPPTWTTTTIGAQPYYGVVNESHSEIVIKRNGKPDIRVGETLEAIMDRLAMLSPDFEKIEKYPALREAYENYRLIEAMIAAGEDGE